jgi:hypothetical protein
VVGDACPEDAEAHGDEVADVIAVAVADACDIEHDVVDPAPSGIGHACDDAAAEPPKENPGVANGACAAVRAVQEGEEGADATVDQACVVVRVAREAGDGALAMPSVASETVLRILASKTAQR